MIILPPTNILLEKYHQLACRDWTHNIMQSIQLHVKFNWAEKDTSLPVLMSHMPHSAPLYVTMPSMQQRRIAPNHNVKGESKKQ